MKKLICLLAVALLCVAPGTQAADVVTKGAAWLVPATRGSQPFSVTNGVSNPGYPSVLRVSTYQLTNHFVITTNGGFVHVRSGTNYVGFTGTVFNPSNVMYYFNGLLITTNGFNVASNGLPAFP